MKKTLAGVGSLLGAGALAAGAALAASPANAATIATFNDINLRTTQLPNGVFVAAGVDRRNGNVIGYSTLRGKESGEEVQISAAFALRGGLIYVNFREQTDDNVLNGRVNGGTGVYDDATGTAVARSVSENTTAISITYNN